METVLYFVIATLLGMNIFVFRKNLKDKQQYNQDRESFLLERASVEKEHADNINQLLERSASDIANIKQEAINAVTEAGNKLQQAETEMSEANEQIQQMYQYVDSLVETIDALSETYEDLKDYSFEVHERLVEFNLFLINKLRGGFLEDNEEVRELVNQIRTFLRDSQDIQDRHGDLFLKEEDDVESIDEDIEESMEEFFDDEEFDEQEFLESAEQEKSAFAIEPNFRIKRNYESDKYE